MLNVIQYPTPTAARCFKLGQAIRRAIDSYEPDVRVAVVGTGGMSHQLQGQRSGHINSEFDRMFLEKVATDPQSLTEITTADYIRFAGSEGAEMIMWLVMRGAMDENVKAVYSARFRVSGGEWQEIGETITTVGPDAELRVVEGTPLLAAADR